MSRSTADIYRRFAETDAAGTLYAPVALALGASDEALRAVEAVPARRRRPGVVLAALHDLALAGRAPALAAAYAAGDGDAAAAAAVDTLRRRGDDVAAVAGRRRLRSGETGRCAVLYPLIAEAARRAGADAIGLVDVGCSAGFNLTVDRVHLTYDGGPTLGDPASPLRMAAAIVQHRPVPARAVPEVVARIGIDREPVDVTDSDEARWLRACRPPDAPDAAELDAQIALAASVASVLLAGDVLEVLPDALARVPADALPVVTTTWTLSDLAPEQRLRFLQRLDEVAAGRTVAWVSAEGVGVAPAIPTQGDRRASGHSILGVALLDHTTVRTQAVGRCWSRGRLLAWTTDA
ncbi:DUF2332 domain-containing protein [Actinomycetospora sp. CA-101289]|uniref:DUF2332 domain-containing protein n=1 Tax=Actinomycetospora sp. CA-101289 TaxID=3239893 RepID=UPI003D99BB89